MMTMTKNPPAEGQQVQVKLFDGDWQAATYRGGGYIDTYGLPLDPTRIAQWRPAAGTVQPHVAEPARRFGGAAI